MVQYWKAKDVACNKTWCTSVESEGEQNLLHVESEFYIKT
jgi:hypothetical protein